MTLKQIKRDFPLSYKLIRECYSPKYFFGTRDLYDFFDLNGIFVMIFCANKKMWAYEVMMVDSHSSGYKFDSRLEAEESGFKKAFELFERVAGNDVV